MDKSGLGSKRFLETSMASPLWCLYNQCRLTILFSAFIGCCLYSKENTKKHHYLEAASARRASVPPFIATCDAVLDIEAKGYLKAGLLFSSQYMGIAIQYDYWLAQSPNPSLHFMFCKSIAMLPGCQTKWWGARTEDGASLYACSIDIDEWDHMHFYMYCSNSNGVSIFVFCLMCCY